MKRFMMPMLAVMVLCVGVALAQDTSTNTMTVAGTVVSTDNDMLTIKTDTGETMTFSLDKSKLDPARLSLGAGKRVQVTHTMGTTGTNQMVATNITLLDDTSNQNQTGTPSTTDNTYAQDNTANDNLPGTASPLPIFGLLGLLALAGSLVLRAASRPSA